jgi:hypothetical protein
VGVWSQPLRDTELWTAGCYWLVEITEKDDNRKVTAEDRNTLISQDFNNWYSQLSNDSNLKVDHGQLTNKLQTWIVERAQKKYPPTQAATS